MEILYDNIGKSYDITRKADPEITRRLKGHLQSIRGSILDVACGTGNYTLALNNLGFKMAGVDISKEMIKKAKEKNNEIAWDLADVERLLYSNNTFNGAICILSIHHFNNLLESFKEIYRVIDKGRFVIFTSSPEQIERYWLNEYFPQAIKDSVKQMPSVSLVTDTLRQAGFTIVGLETFLIQPDLQDFFLYSGKYEPEMYLDARVRSGISTFANLASKEEVEKGCNKLRQDSNNGSIRNVLEKYSSDLGDYLFVIAEKN